MTLSVLILGLAIGYFLRTHEERYVESNQPAVTTSPAATAGNGSAVPQDTFRPISGYTGEGSDS